MIFKLALWISLPALLFAQSTGSIVGTVADTSGAVIPTAAVKVIASSTDQQSSTATDSAGRFSFPRLPVGDYRVEVSHQGFRPSVSETIRLDADQSRLVNFVLEVGAASESVTVTGAVGLVETVGGTIKETVDEKRMVDLPLNGRNPLQLQLLVPGVVLGTASVSLSQNTFITINGARGAQNNYLLDGGDNNDPLTNSASIVPNPDALVEFSILTNNFSAEYGRNVGGVVNAITKSGTNQFHGALYEFLRNDDLDARNFFSLQKPKLRRNQFGGTLGGPVRIPRLYNGHDRTFFFFSYQGVRDREANTFSSLVAPTALEREGDFSQSKQKPVDPLTKAAFPGGIIPASRFDPASVNFIKLLVPLPNTPTGQFIYNQPQNLNSDELLGRVDHSLTSKQRLTVRTFYEWEQTYLTAGLPDLHSTVNFHTYHDILNHTYTITPHLLNTAQFTFSRVDLKRGPTPIAGGVTYQSLGVKVHSDTPQYPEDFRGSVSGFWNMNQDNLVYINRKTFQWTDQLSYTIGAHMIKLGGEVRTTISDRLTANLTDPQFTFDGHAAVNPMADFLLGLPSIMNQGSLRLNQGRGKSFSLYAQDDYKVKPNFTLSLGLRWEPNFPLYDAGNQFSVFRPGKQSTLYPTAPVGLEYAGDPGVPRGGAPTDWKDFGPRAGFAWTPFKGGKTSIRAAYGIFYDTPDFYSLTAFANTQPFSAQVSINQPHSFSDPYFGMVDPFPYKPPTSADQRSTIKYLSPSIIGESVDPSLTAAYVQQWNFNIQQQIVQQIVLTAGYVGSKGTRLELLRELDPGIFGPNATLANVDSRRVYAPNFGSISDFESTGASTYNALQLSLNKRFNHGYTVLANYTFAKSLDNASNDQASSAQNSLNLKPEKGPSDFNVGQRFVTSFLWETPAPKQGVARMLLGHWQLNGIFTAQTGTPVNIVSGRDVALAGSGVQRPNLVGDPFLSTSRSRAQLLQEFFNPAAFVLPATGTFGNVGRDLLTGPGSYNMDTSLFRSFHLKERANLQFRWEVFNSLNHANLANPVASLATATVGRILSASSPRILQFGLKLIY